MTTAVFHRVLCAVVMEITVRLGRYVPVPAEVQILANHYLVLRKSAILHGYRVGLTYLKNVRNMYKKLLLLFIHYIRL